MCQRFIFVAVCSAFGLILVGARGCDISAETDGLEYTVGDEGVSTLYNDDSVTAYLPGCAAFNLEQSVDSQWVDLGPNVICIWEGVVNPLPAGESFQTPFFNTDPGTFRLHYVVSFGCTEGEPMSQADCDSSQDVYTNEFQVAEPVTCDYYDMTYQAGDQFPAFDMCNSCTCTADGEVACTEMACECDGEEWNRDYKANDVDTCAVLNFYCSPNLFYFINDCGCGCQQAPWCEESYDCEPPTDCSFEQAHCPFSTFAL